MLATFGNLSKLVIITKLNKEIKMKDIKIFLIGFLTCGCLFLIMGQTKAENQNGGIKQFLRINMNLFIYLIPERGQFILK